MVNTDNWYNNIMHYTVHFQDTIYMQTKMSLTPTQNKLKSVISWAYLFLIEFNREGRGPKRFSYLFLTKSISREILYPW